MHWNIVTLFPEFFTSPLSCALLGSAQKRGLVSFSFYNPRDMADDPHRTVDDRPYGGGPGMVMKLDPLVRTLRAIPEPGPMLLLSASGAPLTQERAAALSCEASATLICGRYEGVDGRLEEMFPLEPVSVGETIYNGGEVAALAVVESASRLLPGFMGHAQSGEEESFSQGLLEYPHYTRPEMYEGKRVPEVLLGGDHARIAQWRREQSLLATWRRRPDMLAQAPLSRADERFLRQEQGVSPASRLWLGLVHYPVLSAEKKSMAVSLTNLDIHDICRSSCTYGLAGVYFITPLADQRALLETLLAHWREEGGHRAQALALARGAASVAEAVEDISTRAGRRPRVLATGAGAQATLGRADMRRQLAREPHLLLLGTGHGLAPEVVAGCDGCLGAIRPAAAYNHLSVRSAAAVLLDRLFGDWR